MTERSFDKADQQRFADLSVDYNPVHMDEAAARRTMFGRPIVHGIHIALWMLDWFAANDAPSLPFRKIVGRFNRPLFLGETATIDVRPNGEGIDLLCTSDGALLTQLKLSEPGVLGSGAWVPGHASWSHAPIDLDIASMANCQADLSLPYQEADLTQFFPAAVKHYGAPAIAHIIGLTRIVGMEVPGLHSLFAGFSIELHDGSSDVLSYATSRINAKTSHVQLKFTSDVLTGIADTFARPQSTGIDYETVASEVQRGEFAGRRCLIVGGSRGLGLVTAYLLNAGGAEVVITYRIGREEAEAGLETMIKAGGMASAVALDVAAPSAGFASLATQGFAPTDVYYFATPHIFERKKALFEREIFDRFVKCYVTDFSALIDACRRLTSEPVALFYPSSDALNSPIKELMEYTAAKAAGELFCEMASQFSPGIKILQVRLPRLPTDQTATLMKIGAADPVAIMLDICRKMSPPS